MHTQLARNVFFLLLPPLGEGWDGGLCALQPTFRWATTQEAPIPAFPKGGKEQYTPSSRTAFLPPLPPKGEKVPCSHFF